MEPSLLALGMTLFAAALVPLTGGRLLAATGLMSAGATSWGIGALGDPWLVVGSVAVFAAAALGVAASWHLVYRRPAAPVRPPSHNS